MAKEKHPRGGVNSMGIDLWIRFTLCIQVDRGTLVLNQISYKRQRLLQQNNNNNQDPLTYVHCSMPYHVLQPDKPLIARLFGDLQIKS